MDFIPFATPFHILDYPGCEQISVLAFARSILNTMVATSEE